MYIDTHAHLTLPELAGQTSELLDRARDAFVDGVIVPSTTVEDSRLALALAAAYDQVYAAVGIHPQDIPENIDEAGRLIRECIQADKDKSKPVCAVGECGLDLYWKQDNLKEQQTLFREMISLAREYSLPLILHSRSAEDEVWDVLKDYYTEKDIYSGVLHCFQGTPEQAERFINRGFYLSFTGNITYKKSETIKETARSIPLQRLLLETDSPYLAPQKYRGKRNEPSYISEICACIAELRGMEGADLARITSYNAKSLFKLSMVPSREKIAYAINNVLYLNITTRCTSSCIFCICYYTRFYKGHDLMLSKEPSVEDIRKAAGDPSHYKELVFCGFGEPTLRLDMMKDTAARIKKMSPNTRIRLNTNGLGSLINKRPIVPELVGLIDSISVSLNAGSSEEYMRLCNPCFGEESFGAVKDFIRSSKELIPEVTATAVEIPELDKAACQKTAAGLGVELTFRPFKPIG